MQDNRRGNLWVWVGIVVVIVIVILFFVWKPKPVTAPPSGPTPTYAPTGQLTPQFPKDLILDNAAQVAQSYSIDYSTSTQQYTATWDSSSTMASLFAEYKTYLSGNGWTITGTSNKYATLRGVYAENASANLNVGIVPKGQGSEVTISYVMK